MQLRGARRGDCHRLSYADVEEGPRAGGDGIPERPGLVKDLETDVDCDRVEIRANEVRLQVVVLDHT